MLLFPFGMWVAISNHSGLPSSFCKARSAFFDVEGKLEALPIDREKDFFQMPLVAGSWVMSPQHHGIGLAEFAAPPPDRLLADVNPAHCHQFFDTAKAERKAIVQSDTTADDLGREAVAFADHRGVIHAASMPCSSLFEQLTS
jgi:hypothetical protein